ncbi:polyprenol monophosphomannose synthase [Desulfococcus sp.]|uniref:polyprenol monophosphomannose synthase n=1 Tax=Desulfococcus sp. TaxID=2025834 RepID=UPI0035945C4D
MPSPGPEISIIVPTYNEINNVGPLIQVLHHVLRGVRWEVIFVDDDSPDGTAELAQKMGRKDNRIRCIQRIHRRGLSSACIEGMLSSAAPYLAVMDGDMQHDEKLLPLMLNILKTGEIDVAIGSRYAEGGGIGDWDPHRSRMSRLATRLSRLIVKGPITDPMSGFFMIRRTALVHSIRGISGLGGKILLDLLASSPIPLRCRELPYQFRSRLSGESKWDGRAAWGFGMLLLDKLMKRRTGALYAPPPHGL